MMDQLVNTVAEKTGLSPEQAKAAAEAVIGFLKDKLPAPIAGALDGAIGGEGSGGGGVLDSLGGMFGGSGVE
ncbi:MAG: DUF2267 domain-containing protein [Acidobacteria bacterium]|nr:DUF2267 domain-containing protein [Acidobacteriota bacterium]